MDTASEPAGGKQEVVKETPFLLEKGNVSPDTKASRQPTNMPFLQKSICTLFSKESSWFQKYHVSSGRVILNKYIF